VSRLLKDRKDELDEAQLQLKEGSVLSEISKAKAKGETPEGMALRAQKAQRTLSVEEMATPDVLGTIAKLYALYQAELESADALDFDDLLGYGLKLFTTDKSILEKCRHILVDEFQDTNTTQYELMKSFARAHPDGGVSIVGDPDQSIYGWRSAEVENLDHMRRDFKNVKAIHLEENYRSTGAILAVSHSIVSQGGCLVFRINTNVRPPTYQEGPLHVAPKVHTCDP
jgi:DNA helicase-2/ATP-dependent DNA helicase PcrA